MDSQRPNTVEERYLGVREAAEILELPEEQIHDLVAQKKLNAYTVAGAFLRFKKEEVNELKRHWRIERELFPKDLRHLVPPEEHHFQEGVVEKVKDFWYFNDFYIYCILISAVLLYFIMSSH